MSLSHRKKEFLFVAIGLLLAVLFALLFFIGCDGNSAKLTDQMSKVVKTTEDIKAEQKVQGDNNTQMFTKITETNETTIQQNTKLNEQLTKSNKIQAENIDNPKSLLSPIRFYFCLS